MEEGNQEVMLNVRVTKKLRDQLRAAAAKEHRKISPYVRLVLEDHVTRSTSKVKTKGA